MNTFQYRRRSLLHSAIGLTIGGASITATHATTHATATPDWDALAASYDLADDIVNLENGYFGVMARPVLEDYQRNLAYLNRHNSHHLRTRFDRAGIEAVRARLAAHAGVAPHEIALTRGATEALQNLILNYRPLKAGDSVMVSNLDYGTALDAMRALAKRREALVVSVSLPEPATRQGVVDAYEAALRQHPRTRLLLLTHVSHRTGLVLPVADIARIARTRGVDVVVDVAHSYGQLDFRIADLGADFVAATLHKWIGAPLGLGFLYIRDGRLPDVDIESGNTEFPDSDIRARVHAGTVNVAGVMTIPAALDFHDRIPLTIRAARMGALRDYWVARVRDLPQVQILAPDDMRGAITSFRLAGQVTPAANQALARRLAQDFGIFTVARDGPLGGSCIRVTPSYFTTTAQLDQLVNAIRTLAA